MDCAQSFFLHGIAADSGENYGYTKQYARICIGHDDATFSLLVQRLKDFIREKKSSSYSASIANLPDQGDSRTPVHSSHPGLLSASDMRRAVTTVPRPEYSGDGYESIMPTLNVHIKRHVSVNPNNFVLVPCEELTLEELREIQTHLFNVHHPGLASLYPLSDPRASAWEREGPKIGPSGGVEKEDVLSLHLLEEGEILASSGGDGGLAKELLRHASCHRAVMQFAHHLSEETRKRLPAGFTIPLLSLRLQPTTLHLRWGIGCLFQCHLVYYMPFFFNPSLGILWLSPRAFCPPLAGCVHGQIRAHHQRYGECLKPTLVHRGATINAPASCKVPPTFFPHDADGRGLQRLRFAFSSRRFAIGV